jgi:hypothetical protein
MAFTLSPLYGQAGTYTAQQDRLLVAAQAGTSGVRKLPSASGGAMTGDLAVTSTGTGNGSVSVATGNVMIPWTAATGQGFYYAYNDAATTVGPFAANSSGNPRIDLVSVQVADTGSATPTVSFVITQGTPGASPSAPSTPSNATPLCQVAIANGWTTTSTVSNANLTDIRQKGFLPDLSISSTVNATGTTLTAVPSPTTGNLLYHDTGDHLVTYDATNGYIQVPQVSGIRNVLINASMIIDQRNRGASQTITAGAALAYTVDRWYAYCTGANITGTQYAAGSGQYGYRFTGATSNAAVGFGQRIEGVNAAYLTNQQVVLSCNIASSSLTSVTWTAYYANSVDAFGTVASPTRTQIATGTFTISSTLTRYQATFNAGANAMNGVEILFTTGALTAANTLTFTRPQFELGAVASTFEIRSYGQELPLCQRYFYKIYSTGSGVGAVFLGSNTSATATEIVGRHPVTMRVAPTFAVSAASDFQISSGTFLYSPATGFNNTGVTTAELYGNNVQYTTGGMTAGYASKVIPVNSNATYQQSAEL